MNSSNLPHDPLAVLGVVALGSRLRRLSEYLFKEVEAIYKYKEIHFQPRFFPVLAILANREKAGVVELANAMGVTHAAVSQILKPLTKAKLIKISSDSNDARAKCISLSVDGQKLVRELQPIWAKLKAVLLEELEHSAPNFMKMLGNIETSFGSVSLSERVLEDKSPRAMVQVVTWEPGYKNTFKDLNLHWIQEYFGEIEAADIEVFENAEQYVEDGGMIFFAKSASTVIGTCLLIRKPHNTFELAKMAVSPLARGKGAGAELLRAAISWAREQGAKEIVLETASQLSAANKLYKKFGFQAAPDILAQTKYARVDRAYRLSLPGSR
jgi:DNA-binding MarR family transcriptional regulator/GNAT superfamily N-acetyltransferase